MRHPGIIEESLETMVERVERQQIQEEQTELDRFEELERDLATWDVEPWWDEEFVREDEFTCRRCRMILHRSRMADRRRRLCGDCADRS